MRINSINRNQSFGRLKITYEDGYDGSGKPFRRKLLAYAPIKIFDEIDKLSGDTPVEIRFCSVFSVMDGTYGAFVKTYIGENEKPFTRVPIDSYEELHKEVLLKIKKYFRPNFRPNKQNSIERKYFA